MSWLVAILEPGRDHLAERSLHRTGWRTYFPRYAKQLTFKLNENGKRSGCRHGGEIVSRPLFPGYGFVEWHTDQQWRVMEEANGVLGFLMKDERPAVLSGEIIEELRERVNAGEFDQHRPSRKAIVRTDLEPGTMVRMTEGPFATFLGTLQNVNDENRARLLVRAIGGVETLVRGVDANSLERVEAAE